METETQDVGYDKDAWIRVLEKSLRVMDAAEKRAASRAACAEREVVRLRSELAARVVAS